MPGTFHVEVHFDPAFTTSAANPHGKPPVMLYNRNFEKDIVP
jgi:hypothetical protein